MKTSERVFQQLRGRSVKYEADGFPECDELCIPWLKFFNAQPGLTCVFCCQGHATKSIPYLMFAFEEEGLQFLEQAVVELNSKLIAAGQFPGMTLMLRFKLNPEVYPRREPYLAATLSWDFIPLDLDYRLHKEKRRAALPIVQRVLSEFTSKPSE